LPAHETEYRHCVIGPGRLGTALLAALQARGGAVAAVGVRRRSRIDAQTRPPRLSVPDAVAAAAVGDGVAVIWITVPDDAIGAAAADVARAVTASAAHPGRAVALHTSGLGSLELLRPLAAAGVTTLALHPLQSFPVGAGADALDDVPVAVTAADGAGRDLGFTLAEAIGGRPFALPDGSRPRYHLAAVVASNLLVALQAEAADLLREAAGGTARDAIERLRPLVTTTLANIHARGPERALTGPVARGDVGTVRAHLRILDQRAPRYAAAYRALSLEALALAAPRLDDEAVSALHELLGPFPGQTSLAAEVETARGRTTAGREPATAGPAAASRPARTAAGRARAPGAAAGRSDGKTAAAPMIVARTAAEMRASCATLPRPLGFVPTMGALHDGHLELVRRAHRQCAAVVASVFVNPTQFGPGEDYAAYPRGEARDLDLLRAEGVAAVFVPAVAEVYPRGFTTAVRVDGPLSETFEGHDRPGHFDGVATVVAKLLAVTGPDVLFLGEKDAQQLALLRRVVRDLQLPVDVVGVPTVREPDGLAMSSRNRRLSADERRVAPRLYAALQAGRRAARAAAGAPAPADDVLAAVRAGLQPQHPSEPAFAIDYVALVDPRTFEPLDHASDDALIIAAARLGSVRLIDNLALGPALDSEPLPLPDRELDPDTVPAPGPAPALEPGSALDPPNDDRHLRPAGRQRRRTGRHNRRER